MRVWRLNETGRPELDKLTIEYNGLVIDDTVKRGSNPSWCSTCLTKAASGMNCSSTRCADRSRHPG